MLLHETFDSYLAPRDQSEMGSGLRAHDRQIIKHEKVAIFRWTPERLMFVTNNIQSFSYSAMSPVFLIREVKTFLCVCYSTFSLIVFSFKKKKL